MITNVVSASPSSSSAIISTGLEACTVSSNTGSISFILDIFLSVIRIYGLSNSAVILSVSVTI